MNAAAIEIPQKQSLQKIKQNASNAPLIPEPLPINLSSSPGYPNIKKT